MDYWCSMLMRNGSDDGSRALAGAIGVPADPDTASTHSAAPLAIDGREGRDAQG